MKATLYVERLRRVHLPLVVVAAALGVDVAVFDLGRDIRNVVTYRRMEAEGRLRRLPFQPMQGCEELAIELAAEAVDGGAERATVTVLRELFDDDEATLLVKRAFAEALSRALFVRNRIAAEGSSGRRGWFLGDESEWVLAHVGEDVPPLRARRVVPARAARAVVSARSGGQHAVAMLRTFVRLVLLRQRATSPPERFVTAVGINSAFLLKFRGPRRFDFLVDDDLVCRDETVFLLECAAPPGFLEEQRAAGTVVRTGATGAGRIGGTWVRPAQRAAVRLARSAFGSPVAHEAASSALYAWRSWHSLLERVRFEHYVFTNKEDRTQMAGNLVLRRAGIQTWNYSLFIGGPYLFDAPSSPHDARHHLWSFLNSDHWLLNNRAMERSFALHHQAVRSYDVIGDVFAELIAGAQASRPELRARWGIPPSASVVAVFDTTFVDLDYAITTYDDGAAFYDDLCAIADARPEQWFLVKPSKAASYFLDERAAWSSPRGREVVRRMDAAGTRANVVFLGDDADPTEVIAAADATVTHCFSSPTADALAAGLPGAWYESGRRHVGFPLDDVDGLVLHGLDALLRWLDDPTGADDDRAAALDDLIDPFRDGRALHRMRSLLAGAGVVRRA